MKNSKAVILFLTVWFLFWLMVKAIAGMGPWHETYREAMFWLQVVAVTCLGIGMFIPIILANKK